MRILRYMGFHSSVCPSFPYAQNSVPERVISDLGHAPHMIEIKVTCATTCVGGIGNRAPFPSALVVFGNDSSVKRYIAQCIKCDGVFATQRSDAQTCGGACRVRLQSATLAPVLKRHRQCCPMKREGS